MNAKKIVLAVVAVVAVALFFYFDVQRFLTLAALKANRQSLLDYYAAHQLMMVAGFMLLYIVQTALSLPGAAILSLAAGAIFGVVMGTIYANIAATIGATLAFLVTRYLLRDVVLNKFGSKLERMNRELESRGFSYLLFLRLVPVFPFFLINLAAGLTRLPLRTFFFGTMLGIIPGGFVYVNAGASLATIDSLAGIASPRVLGSFALLGLFALIPVLYNKFKSRKQRAASSARENKMELITKEQATTAIAHGEFGDDILHSAESVAIILTQSWCPQWHGMKQFVTGFSAARIFVLEYDRTDYFDQFREFKERVLGNDRIPYVRYYAHGILVAESNAVPEETFRQNLEK